MVFRVHVKQQINERLLGYFFSTCTANKNLQNAGLAWFTDKVLLIRCTDTIWLNTLCKALNEEGARSLIHVTGIFTADLASRRTLQDQNLVQGHVGLENALEMERLKKEEQIIENTRLTAEAQGLRDQLEREAQERAVVEGQFRVQLEREAQERAVVEGQFRVQLEREAQERAVVEGQLRDQLERKAQERAGVEGQLRGTIKALEEQAELRDLVATEEAQELHARIKKLENEAVENADVGSKRARSGGEEALMSGVMAMLEQSAFRERDAALRERDMALKAADERVADAHRERDAALKTADERVADALRQRDAALKSMSLTETKAKDKEVVAGIMKKQRDAASDRQRKASSVITKFLDAMDIVEPVEKQHALVFACNTAAKLRTYINCYTYDGIGGAPSAVHPGNNYAPLHQSNLDGFIVVSDE